MTCGSCAWSFAALSIASRRFCLSRMHSYRGRPSICPVLFILFSPLFARRPLPSPFREYQGRMCASAGTTVRPAVVFQQELRPHRFPHPHLQGWSVILGVARPDVRISLRSTIVEVRIERASIVVVVVVATYIREIRRVDIAIIGERLTFRRFLDSAVHYGACEGFPLRKSPDSITLYIAFVAWNVRKKIAQEGGACAPVCRASPPAQPCGSGTLVKDGRRGATRCPNKSPKHYSRSTHGKGQHCRRRCRSSHPHPGNAKS